MGEEDLPTWFRRRRSPFFFGDPFKEFLGIEEYMKDIDKVMEGIFKEMEARVPRELIRERRLSDGRTLREMGPFVYGYTLHVGPDGKPRFRQFGNIRPSLAPKPSLEVSELREPIVDVMDEEDRVKVVAEVPGVEKEDVRLQCEERALAISVEVGPRKYHKTIDLPSEVDPNSAKATYKNGILEVTLSKLKKKPKGYQVKIE